MAELARPDVTVRQVFTTTSPTTTAPLLRGCVVGPCLQVVPATIKSATGTPLINGDANVTLPASFQAKDASGDPPVYGLSARSALEFSVNNKLKVSAIFLNAGNYTPSDVVKVLREALALVEETDVVAEVVGTTPTTGTSFRVRTLARDEFQQIELDPDPAAPALVAGTVDLTTLAYPGDVSGKTLIVSVNDGAPQTITIGAPVDENALITALTTITGAAAQLGAGDILELFTDVSDAGASLEIIGGTLLSTVGLTAGDRSVGAGSTSSLLAAFGLSAKDIYFGASRYAGWELSVPPGSFPDPRGNLAELVFKTSSIRGFLNASGSVLREALRTSAPLRRGTAAVTAIDDGNGDNKTPYLEVAGANFLNPVAAAAVITGAGAPNFASLSNKSLILGDGRNPRTIQFGTVANITDVVNAINAQFDTLDGLLASNSGGFLRLTCTRKREDGTTECKGEDSFVVIYGGTAFSGANNYLDSAVSPNLVPGRYTGDPYKAKVGDELFVDGVSMGKIVRVAPGGITNRLQLSKQQVLAFTGSSYHIIANGLAAGNMERIAPSLIVESDGQAVFKPGILRDSIGRVSEAVVGTTLIPGKADLYVSYEALRLDVSSKKRGLLQLTSLEQVEALLAPIDTTNPLGLAAYLAMQNAPGTQITALGVDEISPDYPEGTPAAYARAAIKLEAHDVYSIALLTHSQDAAEVFQSHVTEMSAPERKSERLLLWCPSEPERELDTLIASGSRGNVVGSGGTTFDTGVSDLPLLLQEAGIDPTGAIPVSSGLYLDIDGDTNRYAIVAVSGSVVTVTATFSPGENEDSYFSNDLIGTTYIDTAFAVRVRGDELVLSDGSPDLDRIADTYSELGQSFNDRRVWVMGPDEVVSVVDGIEQNIPGYYGSACVSGMITKYSVSQSFTNLGMSGIKGVTKSNGRFTEKQLDRMAGGGIYILVQDSPTSPVIARQAITSDSTDEVRRIDIVLKEIDLLAKVIRRSLRSKIGVQNISEDLFDQISTTLQAVVDFMVGKDFIEAVEILRIEKDEKRVDGTAVAIKAYPHFPNNGIDVTIYV